jgi:hypothetical protein
MLIMDQLVTLIDGRMTGYVMGAERTGETAEATRVSVARVNARITAYDRMQS